MEISIDLQNERNKCDFNKEELTNYLDGSPKYTEKRREIENKVLSHKELFDGVPEEYLSHKEKFENAIRKAVLLHKVLLESGVSYDVESFSGNLRNMVSQAIFKDSSPFMLHVGMFVQTILGQGNAEQAAYWMGRVMKNEIIGTYAQTELGHGTFIRGLETRATYDPKTEEFILHSPSITAYKWWPGGLGHTANYCVVIAHLYIDGKSRGIQPFMVQIRDEETHMPLPGIKVGEIGAKLGFNTVNNGFLGFENFRIPRKRMLMKNAEVLKDGTFKAVPNSKLTYGTMVYVRVTIVNSMANQLAKAVTIAVRYSAVRRQSQLKPDEPEPLIMDYVTQQHKLFIAIATSMAFTVTARWLWDMYYNFTKELAAGNMKKLPELHSLSCCLKAVSTSDCAQLVERCRMSCGGHGYMLSSNLPQIYGGVTAACTYEGENTVLMLQTARSLVKAWNQLIHKGEPLSPSMIYLSDRKPMKEFDGTVQGLIRNFQIVAKSKLIASVKSLQRHIKSGASAEDAWNMASVQLVATAEAHCRVVILSTFKSEIEKAALSRPLKTVVTQLVELYAIYWTLEKLGDLLLYTNLSEKNVYALQRKYEDLLSKIRPNAVGLVDAFDIRDEVLSSTLGSYDGRVYERLMAEALKSPLNAQPVDDSFHKYLKPFMQGKL